MSDGLSRDSRAALVKARDEVLNVVVDQAGIERPTHPESRLAAEIADSEHASARHFLRELPKHCSLLVTAVADGLAALSRLDPELAFSGVLVARGVLEAAADLHWLSDARIDHVERARRTFLVYLRQEETVVRRVAELSERLPPGEVPPGAVDEGWARLKATAEDMASAGYELKTSSKPGSRYSVGTPKPPISQLVETLIQDSLGTTATRVYPAYSSAAHAEGEGLGALLVMTDSVETPEGTRYRRGLDEEEWRERLLAPATRGVRTSVAAW